MYVCIIYLFTLSLICLLSIPYLPIYLSIHPSTVSCWFYFSGGSWITSKGLTIAIYWKYGDSTVLILGLRDLEGSWVQLDLLKDLQKNQTFPVSPEKDGMQKICIYLKDQENKNTVGSAGSRLSRVVDLWLGSVWETWGALKMRRVTRWRAPSPSVLTPLFPPNPQLSGAK